MLVLYFLQVQKRFLLRYWVVTESPLRLHTYSKRRNNYFFGTCARWLHATLLTWPSSWHGVLRYIYIFVPPALAHKFHVAVLNNFLVLAHAFHVTFRSYDFTKRIGGFLFRFLVIRLGMSSWKMSLFSHHAGLRNMARNNHFLETGQPDVSKIAQPTRNRCQRWNKGIKTESKGGTGKQEHDQPNLLHLPRSKPRRHAAQTVHLNQPHAASVARATRKWQSQPKLSQLLREST